MNKSLSFTKASIKLLKQRRRKNLDIFFVQLSSVVDLAKLVNSQYIVLSYYTLVLQKYYV